MVDFDAFMVILEELKTILRQKVGICICIVLDLFNEHRLIEFVWEIK